MAKIISNLVHHLSDFRVFESENTQGKGNKTLNCKWSIMCCHLIDHETCRSRLSNIRVKFKTGSASGGPENDSPDSGWTFNREVLVLVYYRDLSPFGVPASGISTTTDGTLRKLSA